MDSKNQKCCFAFRLQVLTVMAQKLKAKSAVFEYFSTSGDGKHFICQCGKSKDDSDDSDDVCGAKISAYSAEGKHGPSRASNLKRHLKRHHSEAFSAVEKADSTVAATSSEVTHSSRQTSLKKFLVDNKVTVTMTATDFKMCIIEMVVKNGVPLRFFCKRSFYEIEWRNG